MDTLIPAFPGRPPNQRRLTLAMLSAKAGIRPQHVSQVESGNGDPRWSSIERMAVVTVSTQAALPARAGGL